MKNINYSKDLKNIIANKGMLVLKNISTKKTIQNLEEKIIKNLDKAALLKTPKKISKRLYKPIDFRGPQGNLKYNLNKNILNKGFKYYKNYTNSVTFKQPLLNFKDCHTLVFNEKVANYASIILGKPAKLGYVAITCLMNNKLPNNCINYLHTDDHLNNKIIEKNRLVKFAIPISTKNRVHNEYHHLTINKHKIKNQIKQYSEIREIPKKYQKKIQAPKLKTGDGLFFDPDNFFHLAKKPKKDIRIILYVVFIKSGNYLENKAKELKIKIKDLDNISLKLRPLAKFIKKI